MRELSGFAVVAAIFISACVALYETIVRLIDPQSPTHLWALAAASLLLPYPDAVDFGSLNIHRKEQHDEYGARD
jgi:Co/Zn/Cd efflux system component